MKTPLFTPEQEKKVFAVMIFCGRVLFLVIMFTIITVLLWIVGRM